MKNYLLSIFWIALTITSFSGCSKNSLNFKDVSLPQGIMIPYLVKLKVDKSLPTVKNLRYRSSLKEIVLEWDIVPSREIAGYRVLKYDPSKKTFIVLKTINDPVSNHYVDSNLDINTEYYYKVSCFTKDGRVSLASKTLKAKTLYTLKPITDLVAISDLPKRIKLSWHLYPQNKLIKFYSIHRSDANTTNWKQIDTIDNSLAVEYIDYSIVDGKSYAYKVIGHTYDGVATPPSNIVTAHSKPLPLTPVINVPPTINEPRKIKVVWFDPNKNRTIVKYNIYTSLFKDTLFTKHASTVKNYYIDNIPEDGKVVYYKVTAVDIDGLESPLPKKAAMGRTKPNSNAPTITEYTIVDGRVVIKWIPPARGIKKYTVIKRYLGKYFVPKTLKITDIKGTMFVDKDIKLGKTYKYQVIGIDSDGIPTKPSHEISITIK